MITFILVVLYCASYTYSMIWFISTNFLDDYKNELTVGTFIHYVIYSIGGPIVCFAVFFSWLLKHDIWMMRMKDIPFKWRHLVQFIPIIGLIGVTLLAVFSVVKHPKISREEHYKYVWFNRICYYISMFWHAVFAFIFL